MLAASKILASAKSLLVAPVQQPQQPNATPVASRTASQTFGQDVLATTSKGQGFVTMSDGHSALNRMAQVSTVVNQVRAVDPAALVFFGGDAIIGTPYYPAGDNGVADMEALHKLGIASFVIGNHDLDGGYDNFVRIAQASNMPLVVANWDITGDLATLQRQVTDPFTGEVQKGANGAPLLENAVQPYRVFTNPENGLKTVSIGLSINPKDYGCLDPRITYNDPAATLAKLLPQIQANPDLKDALIVVQTHLASADAEKLENQFGDKIFFAAHDHMPIALPVEASVNGALSAVTDTGGMYQSPGVYHAEVGPLGKLLQFDGGLVPIDSTVPADPAMVAQLAPVQAIVDRDYGAKLSTLTAPISRTKIAGTGDSALGDWVIDDVKANADAYLVAHGQAPTDLALINATGLRADFPHAGDVSAADVFKILPFDNSTTVITLTADQLQTALNTAAHRAGDPIAGVTADLSTNGASNIMINGKPLGAQPTYRVATLDFMADKGGAGYTVMTQGTDKVPTGLSLRDMLTKTLKDNPTVTLPVQAPRLSFVAPFPQVGPPAPPASATTDSFVGTWDQRVTHYLGKDAVKDGTNDVKTALMKGILHL